MVCYHRTYQNVPFEKEMVNRWSVLLRTEVSSGVLAAMAAHLNELVCPNPVLLRKVAENLLRDESSG